MDYKALRKISPEAARQAVLQYLLSNGNNVAACAKFFGIQRISVYDIISKDKEGDLSDRSKAPKTVRIRKAKGSY